MSFFNQLQFLSTQWEQTMQHRIRLHTLKVWQMNHDLHFTHIYPKIVCFHFFLPIPQFFFQIFLNLRNDDNIILHNNSYCPVQDLRDKAASRKMHNYRLGKDLWCAWHYLESIIHSALNVIVYNLHHTHNHSTIASFLMAQQLILFAKRSKRHLKVSKYEVTMEPQF